MKSCPKCGATHERPGTFCCRKCANGRPHSMETRLRMAESGRKAWAIDPARFTRFTNKPETLRRTSERMLEFYRNRLLSRSWEELSYGQRRRRVILEQGGACSGCSLSEWRGQPITLEYEHRDGDRSNNSRENVVALCPNCHSQTKTWRRNKSTAANGSRLAGAVGGRLEAGWSRSLGT